MSMPIANGIPPQIMCLPFSYKLPLLVNSISKVVMNIHEEIEVFEDG